MEMGRVKRTVWAWVCERCGHEWLPRKQDAPPPRVCPNPPCKSPYWNTPRKSATKKAASMKPNKAAKR
ncbi:MAG TPA: hypothetical protein VF230_11000 [Acidimicrobiales bacterium]